MIPVKAPAAGLSDAGVRTLEATMPLTPTSRTIARIVGPSVVVLAATEAFNMAIFAAQTAPVVYLNGTLLFVAGVAIVQAHNRWRWGWCG